MATKPRLELKPEQDGMGYFYGTLDGGDDHVYRVDILPPLSEPRPLFVMANERMHATDWIIYVDGEEIGRVAKRDDIEAVVRNWLAKK